MDPVAGKAANWWKKLTGDPATFSMENRAFNYVGVITFPILLYTLVFDICISQVFMAWVLGGLLVAQGILFYYSRFKRKYNTGIIVYAILSYSSLIANYYCNSGALGPTLCLFFLTFQLLITIGKRGMYGLWIFLHITIVMGLLASEYFFPQLVPDTYLSKEARFFDLASTYTIAIVFVFTLTNYLRNYFNNERLLAEERAKAISAQNTYILSQNDLLAKVNEEKNKLFSIVSHDLKTPLDSIRGYLELLTEQVVTDLEKTEIEAELLEQTKYTSDLLLNLLYWSKAQMHGIVVNLAGLDLNGMLEEVVNNKRTMAAKKGLELVYDYPGALGVTADKDMMRIILRNVINNAVKFTPAGGTIHVSTEVRGDKVVAVIKDSGIGIQQDRHADLFTLKTASTYGTNNEKGIGLGLMMCREFINYQQGDIWFESIPANGTTFYIALPHMPHFKGRFRDAHTGIHALSPDKATPPGVTP